MKMKIVRPIWDGRDHPRYHPASEPHIPEHMQRLSALNPFLTVERSGAAYFSDS